MDGQKATIARWVEEVVHGHVAHVRGMELVVGEVTR